MTDDDLIDEILRSEPEVLTPLHMFTIFAVASMKAEQRAAVDPTKYFGIVDEVRESANEPIKALQKLFERTCGQGVQWNGKDGVYNWILTESETACRVDFSVAEWGVSQRRREDAVRIVRMAKAVPGSVGQIALSEAKALLLTERKPNPKDSV